MVVTVTTHSALLVLFIVWNFQYAVFTKNESVRYTFYVLGGLYSILATAYGWWVIHQISYAIMSTTTRWKDGDATVFSFEDLKRQSVDEDSDSESHSLVDTL